MRVIANKKTSSADSESGASASTNDGNQGWFRMHWRLVALCVVAVLAFVLRFAFAYGTSAGDHFALSGGTSASSHLRIIVEILYGTYDPANQSSLNYPYGVESVFGPLFDYCCAAWAKLFSAIHPDYVENASLALAVNPPIFAALTTIVVFLIGKKIFKDETIALLAAVFYAVFPLLIMTSPFSYGSELPFVCFLFAGFIYFVICALSAIDETGADGIKAVFTEKSVLKWTLLATVAMTFIIYSWTGFWAIVMAAALIMLFTLLIERIGGKDLGVTISMFIMTIMVPVALGAIFYIPFGMWDAVYSGACVLAVLATVYALIFYAVREKPWVATIPMMAVIMFVVAVVLYFAVPDLSSAILSGNSNAVGELMAALADQSNRVRVSELASYYGWVTLWFPLFMGVWMLYRYRKNSKSKTYAFVMFWFFAAYIASWYSATYAVLAGAAFSVASAALIVKVIRHVNLLAYFRTLRGNGVKAGAKKALKASPLATLIIGVFLIAAPAAVYAYDAATPSNTDSGDYFGGLGYSINTSDSNMINGAWENANSYAHKDKTLLTMYSNADSAVSVGGFSSVTSSNGAGTNVMSSVYLADSSAAAVASLVIRLLGSNVDDYSFILYHAGLDDEFIKLITDKDAAREYIADHPDDFEGYNSDISAENLAYVAGVKHMAKKLTVTEIENLYHEVMIKSGESVNYITVDGSMLPLYYGDGTYANTIGYFGDYALDNYGAPSKFYTVTSTTSYYYQWGYYDQLYYTYNDAFYETFLWNALLGVTPSEYGLSDSTSLLSALAKSDGSVKAVAGSGLSNFNVAYWHVKYQAKDSNDWTDMDIKAALKEQSENGGYINYLSSVVVLEYANSTASQTAFLKTVSDDAVANAKVVVYEKLGFGDQRYVPRCTTYTNANGEYTVRVASSDYLVRFYVGDSLVETLHNTVENVTIPDVGTVSGLIVDQNNTPLLNSGAVITVANSTGKVLSDYQHVAVGDDGSFTLAGLVPDVYAISVCTSTGTVANTVSMSITGGVSDIKVSAAACYIKISVKDVYGNAMGAPVKVCITDAAGSVVMKDISVTDGELTRAVLAGTYTVVIADDNYVSTKATSVTLSKSGTENVELVAYPAGTDYAAGAGSVVMGIGYNNVASSDSIRVPANLADTVVSYKVIDDSNVAINGVSTPAVKFAVKLDTEKVGTIAFINGDKKAFVFSTDADGKLEALLPAGTYTVYATDNSKAIFTEQTVSAGADLKLELVEAFKTTVTVSNRTGMSPSTNNLAFIPVKYTVTIGSADYSFFTLTGDNGQVAVYVPKDAKLVTEVDKNAFAAFDKFVVTENFTKTTDAVTSTVSTTFSINEKQGTGSEPYVKGIAVSGLTITGVTSTKLLFDAYTGTDVYVQIDAMGAIEWVSENDSGSDPLSEFTPGRYTVNTVEANYYLGQTVNVYPTTTVIALSEAKESYAITVTGATSSEKVTVTPVGAGTVYESKDNVYTVAKGFDYTVKIMKDEKMFIKTVAAAETIDAATVTYSDVVTFTGYVGSKVNGTVDVTVNSAVLSADVKDGAFTLDLVKGAILTQIDVDATYTDEAEMYKYVANGNIFTGSITVSENTTRNFVANTVRDEVDTTVAITGTSTSAGILTATVSVKNESTASAVYSIVGSSALVLEKTYVVEVAAGATEAVPVVGYYSATVIGAGSSNATITVSVLGESESVTKIIPAECFAGSVADVTVKVATDADSNVSDALDGYAYNYVFAFTNNGDKAATISGISFGAVASGWLVAATDASGHLVNATEYTVAGHSTTLLYAMCLNDGTATTSTPNVAVTYSVDGVSDTKNVSAQNADVTVTDGSVSGGNADNDKASVSTGFWILTVISVLLILILVWGAMKRGVFARKN